MCPLLQGVESLLLVGGDRWEDGGERIIYAGDDGQTAEQAETLRHALRTNASTRRAIRVVRAHVASAAEMDEDESLLLGAGPALFNIPRGGRRAEPQRVKAHDVRSFHPGQRSALGREGVAAPADVPGRAREGGVQG